MQITLIISTLAASWLAMQVVHEAGHVLGAWLTGGRVRRVVLHPLVLSRTDLAVNPFPLAVAWAGPVFGAAAPFGAWAILWRWGQPIAALIRFFAGFCLVANGAYIGAGSFQRIGDSGDLLRYGAQAWQLWVFGALAVPLGIGLWQGQGPAFGLGAAHGKVDPQMTRISVVVCLVVVVLELGLGGRG